MNVERNRAEILEDILINAFHPVQLLLEDESAIHRGHLGAEGGGSHFDLTIVSAAFEGKSLVQRHRMIYDAIGELMKTDIHALSITAKTPAEI